MFRRGKMKSIKKIVILGAGYGGVHAGKMLAKKFKNNSDVEITLIDRHSYHTLMTELHEVAGNRVDQDSVKISLKKIFSATKVNVVLDNISKIDFEGKKLVSDTDTYSYDYLVIGTGAEPAFFGVPGVKENGFTLWSLDDALKVKEHIKSMFKLASKEKRAEKRKEMLTFVVAGAGFTGIELVGELAEWKKRLCYEYGIDESEVTLYDVEAMAKILPILNDGLIAKAETYLKSIGVNILTNAPIVQVNKDSIVLKDGREIKTHTLVWTCGVQGNEVAANFGLTMGQRQRIQSKDTLQSMDHENVYLVGDNTWYLDGGKPIPQIVETAIQTGETAAHNIIADIEGKEKKAFKLNYHGVMVSLGSKYAVADLMGKSMSGFVAMLMKHIVNLHYLFGVAGINQCLAYIKHEFFGVKDNRSFIGGHIAAKSPSFLLAVLRVYVGVIWLLEGLKKVKDGWLKPENIYIIADATSGASAAGEATANAVTPLLSQPPAIYTWFMDTVIAPIAFPVQAMVVLGEIGIGLALIAGLFTFLAALASVALCCMFIISAMAGKEIFWHFFSGIALMGGAGRSLGLDYYVMPWLKKWWNRTKIARKTYLYMDEPTIKA
jgi:NADH:ubiquinone reductase (H+-translocating)